MRNKSKINMRWKIPVICIQLSPTYLYLFRLLHINSENNGKTLHWIEKWWSDLMRRQMARIEIKSVNQNQGRNRQCDAWWCLKLLLMCVYCGWYMTHVELVVIIGLLWEWICNFDFMLLRVLEDQRRQVSLPKWYQMKSKLSKASKIQIRWN